MNIDTLITMANQIGDFFGAYPDQNQAKKDVASHIKRFWAQPMREQIIKHMQEKQGSGLSPVVQGAITDYLSKEFILSTE
jgi:formate dehydrogenase subunit delta